MKKLVHNIRLALILTPALFLLAYWILALSSSSLIESIGLSKMIFWALLLSFGAAYSISLFVSEIVIRRGIQ